MLAAAAKLATKHRDDVTQSTRPVESSKQRPECTRRSTTAVKHVSNRYVSNKAPPAACAGGLQIQTAWSLLPRSGPPLPWQSPPLPALRLSPCLHPCLELQNSVIRFRYVHTAMPSVVSKESCSYYTGRPRTCYRKYKNFSIRATTTNAQRRTSCCVSQRPYCSHRNQRQRTSHENEQQYLQ
jgi:hypothetical protein